MYTVFIDIYVHGKPSLKNLVNNMGQTLREQALLRRKCMEDDSVVLSTQPAE